MTRETVADGIYYPADPEQLYQAITRTHRECTDLTRNASVVVAPNGGYQITLRYIFTALRAAKPRPELVCILAPPNSSTSTGNALPESDEFATPFGPIPVATGLVEQIVHGEGSFRYDEIAHLGDHSIEIVLPVMHYLFGPVPIIPILCGTLTEEELSASARTLRTVLRGKNVLTIVSGNMSGFTNPEHADLCARQTIRLLMNGPREAVFPGIPMLAHTPRSLWPLILAHLIAPENTRPELLHRGTFETEFEGDTGSVVFASLAYQ